MRTRLATLLCVAAMLAVALGPAVALAAGSTWLVNGAYDNNDQCQGAKTRHCKTIQAAVTAASAGDTVLVAAGTYNEAQVLITKGLSLVGAGIGKSIIDGGGTTSLAATGTIRITVAGGSDHVTVKGFTLQNPAYQPIVKGTNPYNLRVGIYAQSIVSGPIITISGNRIVGTNVATEEEDYGFYSNSSLASLVFINNQITAMGANSILIEKHPGATDVSFNTFDVGVYGSDAYFNMNYDGADVTTLQKVSFNTIDVGTGSAVQPVSAISIVGDFTSASAPGGYTNVQIVDNAITGLTASHRRGIGIWNNAPGNGLYGNVSDAVIARNRITGSGGGFGIRLLGLATNTRIENNTISGTAAGFRGMFVYPQVYPQVLGAAAADHVAIGTIVNSNSFAGTTTGVDWPAGATTLNAENNWWGCVLGPPNAGCALVSANVDYTPFATALASSTTASTHEVGEQGTLNTNLTVNDLYGVQLVVNHLTPVLTFSGGVSKTVGTSPNDWNHTMTFTPRNFAAAAGQTTLASTLRNDDHPGAANLTNGNIATWNYNCGAVGTSGLSYDTTAGTGTLLSDKNGLPILAALTGDSITCMARTGSADGYVGLQGRLNTTSAPAGWNGSAVVLTCVSGDCVAAGAGPYVLSSDAGGHYWLAKVGAGTGVVYGVYSAMVSRRAYLGAAKATNVTINSTTTIIDALGSAPVLWGGDVDDDGIITTVDLGDIGLVFGNSITPDTDADVNGDGVVNIFDLVLAGGNYGKTSSTWS
jgi:hypothetical protein